jgi:hypothetical protein
VAAQLHSNAIIVGVLGPARSVCNVVVLQVTSTGSSLRALMTTSRKSCSHMLLRYRFTWQTRAWPSCAPDGPKLSATYGIVLDTCNAEDHLAERLATRLVPEVLQSVCIVVSG